MHDHVDELIDAAEAVGRTGLDLLLSLEPWTATNARAHSECVALTLRLGVMAGAIDALREAEGVEG